LHAVGNGVSLLPCSRITGVRSTGPAPPNPITGTPRDASTIVGKPGGKVVPAAAKAEAGRTRARKTPARATSLRIG
jgi:hypothetical protein